MSRVKQKGVHRALRSKLSFLYLQVENFVHNHIKENALKNTAVRQRYEHLSAPRFGHFMFPIQILKRVFSKSPKTLMYPISLEAAQMMSLHSKDKLAQTREVGISDCNDLCCVLSLPAMYSGWLLVCVCV